MADLRALVVSYHEPQPDRDSGARRLFHFIEILLDAGWEVRFLAADGIVESRSMHLLQRMGVVVHDGYQTTMEQVLADAPCNLVLIAFWSNAERYLRSIRATSPETRIVVDSVDLHLLRESRRLLRPTGSGLGLSATHGVRMAKELNAYAAADAVLTVSQKEADLIGDLLWDPDLARAAPDFEAFTRSVVPFAERQGMVCIGSFQHPPNIEAVEYLCRRVLPLVDPAILREHPVHIVGNRMTDQVRALGRGLPWVRMVGWVPVVEPYLERARISVVPLLHGAGTKRKVIQALALGTPTVTTSIGAEGLGLEHERHVLVADDPVRFARSIERLITDQALWERLATQAYEQVMATNGPDVARKQFLAAINDTFTRPPKSRIPLGVLPTVGLPERDTVRAQVRQAVARFASDGDVVLVVSQGDDGLLDLGAIRASPFPPQADGTSPAEDPASGDAARQALDALRMGGARFLVVPCSAFAWLERYPELREYLGERCQLVGQDASSVSFLLEDPPDTTTAARSIVATRGNAAHQVVVGRSSGNGVAADGVSPNVRLVAFYLPQYHPIPENDEWWGRGFTEWRGVARARPLFPGHYQPHVPADLGFYDLRLAETRSHQAELARQHGIHGFCYYHYWFSGRQLLERPFQEVLTSGAPDFPFALCWANDPWSRRWDGREDDLLMPQRYSAEDDLAHIRALLPALADPRAIRVDGRPMFLVYRARHLTEPRRMIDTWRAEVERAGLPGLHLVAVETAWDLGWDATTVGFDAKVLFQPQFGWLITDAAKRGAQIPINGQDDLLVYDYENVRTLVREIPPATYRRYELVFPSWDNTARKGGHAVVIHGADPRGYEEWLREAVGRAREQPPAHRLVFLNAWNEWAEGCHLEPDRKHGHAWLEATRRAVGDVESIQALGPALVGTAS